MDTLDALLAGHDPAGLLAALDWCEERGLEAERLYLSRYAEGEAMVRPPFEAGQKWLICTVTLYYVGEVADVGLGWVRLKDAAWVHWTGRLSTLLRVQQWADKEFGGRSPRVEPCGEVVLATQAVVSAYPWRGPLAKEPVQ